MKIRSGFVSNSSSSCFIVHKKLSEKTIEKRLRAILDCYNAVCDLKEKVTYEAAIGSIEKIDEKYYEHILRHYLGEEYYRKEPIVGRMSIRSSSDNSIPYPLFELIECAFDAWRIHLG